MSVRLLRESSDTPNITNRDDTRMIRYAYGNVNGIVKDFGDELSYDVSDSKFSLNSGRVIIQGWEIEVDPKSWTLDLSTIMGSQYYLVYLEVNIAVETAKIKSVYFSETTPSVDPGDDLTKYPQGIARLPLYTFLYDSGVFSDIVKVAKVIPYSGPRLDQLESDILDINSRLDELGFKEGVASVTNINCDFLSNTLIKQGKMVLFNFHALPITILPIIEPNTTGAITVPQEFIPKKETLVRVKVEPYSFGSDYDNYYYDDIPLKVDGTLSLSGGENGIYSINIVNAGWQLP